jgi:hypothetical protein
MWMEVVVVCFEILFLYLCGGTGQSYADFKVVGLRAEVR